MKQFLSAITIGTLAALAIFTSFSFQWPTWVLFIAWLSYYIFGKSLKSALYAFLPITAGISLGITIQLLGDALSLYFGAIGFPIAVFICITSLAYLSKIKILSNVPAWFMGLIIFFSVHPHIEPKPILIIFIPIIVGFIFAYLNDTITSIVQKKYNIL
jgi:hypothetical protein